MICSLLLTRRFSLKMTRACLVTVTLRMMNTSEKDTNTPVVDHNLLIWDWYTWDGMEFKMVLLVIWASWIELLSPVFFTFWTLCLRWGLFWCYNLSHSVSQLRKWVRFWIPLQHQAENIIVSALCFLKFCPLNAYNPMFYTIL